MTQSAQPARKTVLRQAIADMSYHWCPVTANVPTRMTEAGFKAACEGFQEKAFLRRGIAKYQAKKYATCRICKGETVPIGLEIIQLKEFKPDEVKKVATKKMNGTCEVCGREKMMVRSNNGLICCSGCTVLQAAIKKMPDKVVAEIQRLHGDEYFPSAVPVVPVDELFILEIMGKIRKALGVDDEPLHADLPGIVTSRIVELAEVKRLVLGNQDIIDMLNCEIETQAAIIKDLASPALLPDDISETGADIVIKCDMLKKMLVEKNKSYGDSALDPVRVFSRADPEEQLLVRIDDKLSRLSRGKEYAGDDTVMDLTGYLVLLLVYRDRADINMKEAACCRIRKKKEEKREPANRWNCRCERTRIN